MNAITKRWVHTKPVPSSPDMPQNVSRVQGEIHDIPIYGHQGDPTPKEAYRHFIPPNSIVCTWSEHMDAMDTTSLMLSSKTQREGRVANVFSNFADVNFTGSNKTQADNYKLRFWGVSQDGVLDGELAIDEPVAAGRLAIACSGLVPVNNHMTFLETAEHGDYVQLIMCDSGGRWEDEDPRYGTPILKAVSPQKVYEKISQASPLSYHDGDSHSKKAASASIRRLLTHAATYKSGTSNEIDPKSFFNIILYIFPLKKIEHAIPINGDSIEVQFKKFEKCGIDISDVEKGFKCFDFDTGKKKFNQTAKLLTEIEDGKKIFNPFVRLPITSSSYSDMDACLYGTLDTPSFCESLVQVLDRDHNDFMIQTTDPLYLRIFFSLEDLQEEYTKDLSSQDYEKRETAKKEILDLFTAQFNELKTKWSADMNQFADGFEGAEAPIFIGIDHADMAVVFQHRAKGHLQDIDLGTFKTLSDALEKLQKNETNTVVYDIGADAQRVEGLMKQFCEICNNLDGKGHAKTTYDQIEQTIFNKNYEFLQEEDRKIIKTYLINPTDGFSPYYVMSMIKEVFKDKPFFFDHPYRRYAIFKMNKFSDPVYRNLARSMMAINMSEDLLTYGQTEESGGFSTTTGNDAFKTAKNTLLNTVEKISEQDPELREYLKTDAYDKIPSWRQLGLNLLKSTIFIGGGAGAAYLAYRLASDGVGPDGQFNSSDRDFCPANDTPFGDGYCSADGNFSLNSSIHEDISHVIKAYGIPTGSHIQGQTGKDSDQEIQDAVDIENVKAEVEQYPVILENIIGVFRGSTPGEDQFLLDLNIRPLM